MAGRAAPHQISHFPLDDADLDDADLWAVIDSATTSSAFGYRKPLLALKNATNSPIRTPPSLPSSSPSLPPKYRRVEDGEVVQEEMQGVGLRRPQKMGKYGDCSVAAEGKRVVLVRQSPQQLSPKVAFPVSPEAGPVAETSPHSLSGPFPSVDLFKQYQNAALAILEKTDYTTISGNPFIKKSGWRKIAFYFNLSFEIKDKTIEYDENRNVLRAEFVVRAYMQGGRFSDGWGSCERREKRFQKPNHDIPSTAETRAKNKACQDLLGVGQYQAGLGNSYR